MNEYLVIYEPGERNWSAFSPDVPGCVATGKDREETERNFREALTLHLELLAEGGDDIPQPSGIVAGYVAVPEVHSLSPTFADLKEPANVLWTGSA